MLACNGIFMIAFKLAAATKVREKAFAFGFVLDKTTAYIIIQK